MAPPPYHAFVDTPNVPELKVFITENGLGCDTGIRRRSGFNEYPLFFFNPDALRTLCPRETKEYERANHIREERKDT